MTRTTLPVLFLAATLAAVIPMNATGTDWYVDALNGSDSNGGTSWEDAWKTLTYATTATEGESPCVNHIGPGAYSPSTNGETFPIVFQRGTGELRGAGSDVTVLDAEGTYRVLEIT